MESTAKMEDNFQEYSNVPVHVRVMRRFALGFRELILLAVVAIVVMMCIIFVIMFGVSKSGEIAARAQAQKGVLFDNTCFTRGCLDTISYTIDNMNFSVNPCDNFYEYACGNYKKRRPLDADNRDHRPLRDVFLKNREKLRALIERPVKRNTEWASERKLKHLFQSCMDDFTLEKLKGKPFLDQVLVPMGGWYVLGNWDTSQWDLNEALKKVQTDFWVDALWAPRVGTDWNDWQKRSIEIHPAGTGRYMRWFYYTDPASAKIRKDYKKFMRRVASLIVRDSGVSVDSQTLTNRVNQFITDAFSMETHIARIAMTTDRTQSPYADTSKISLVDLKTKTGNLIDWPAQMKYLFDNAGVTDNTKVAVFNFNYLSHIADVINNITQEERARAVHNYLTWRLVEGYVQDLSTDYSHANREVYVDITGYREFRGRWNYCFYYGTVMMKEAVGSLFVADHFAEQNKQKVTDITANMKQALQNMLRQTSWIDEETRTYAERFHRTGIYVGDFNLWKPSMSRWYATSSKTQERHKLGQHGGAKYKMEDYKRFFAYYLQTEEINYLSSRFL